MGVLAFWLSALVLGALALPIAFRLFRRMPDGGAGLAIPLGLVLAGYAYFILRTLDLLSVGRGGYVLVVAMLAVVGVIVARTDPRFRSTLRRATPAILVLSGTFTLLFFGYVAFRAYQPDITGTEQPMDFMYLNTTLTSPDYPPQDPWLAGESVSYYYFGYLQIGLLTSVADVPASTGYNYGLGFTFAAAGTAIASLAYAAGRWVLGRNARRWAMAAGALAVVLLLFVGSLSAIFEWAAAHGHYNRDLYEAFDVEWLIPCDKGQSDDCYSGQLNPRTDAWYPTEFWFWWRGSRIIPNTITEFPFFSFLLGDLHPHVTSIPLVLLTLGIAATTWRGRSVLSLRSHRRPAAGLLLAVVYGALAFANAWDLPTFAALFTVAVLARNLRRLRWPGALNAAVGYLAPIFALAVLAYVPWYVDFSSQADGFYPYIGEGTLPPHAFLQFGVLIAAALCLLTWAGRGSSARDIGNTAVAALWLPLVPLLGWMILAAVRGELQDAIDARGLGGWVTLVAYGAVAWALATAAIVMARAHRPGAAIGAFAAAAVLLLFGSELFYIGDIFVDATPRLNTVFKLSYQAWILLSLSGAVALVSALRYAVRQRVPAGWVAAPAGALAAAGLVYALIALPNRTDGFDKDTATDGLAFLAREDPAEYALTRWIQQNTNADDIVVEASGRRWGRDGQGVLKVVDGQVDYTDAGRIAARTGRLAPIGWYFHEIQWRGLTPQNEARFAALQDLADRVYLASDAANSLAAVRALGAKYVVVGSVEQSRFPTGDMVRFGDFLDVVFQAGDFTLYEVPESQVMRTS